MTTERIRETSLARNPANSGTLTHSQSSSKQLLPAAAKAIADLGTGLKRLTAMKKTVELTPYEVETWVATLSVFDASVVNEAVIRIGLSADPFPDLGKLFQACDRIRRERSSTPAQDGNPKIGTEMMKKVSEALQLVVGQ